MTIGLLVHLINLTNLACLLTISTVKVIAMSTLKELIEMSGMLAAAMLTAKNLTSLHFMQQLKKKMEIAKINTIV